MKYLIVYSSLTGNTKMVAEAIREIMPADTDIFPVTEAPPPDGYDFVAVGFWVDRGTADAKARDYLRRISGKKIALFATLGAYPDSDHARDSLVKAAVLLDPDNTLAGTFICQGKIDPRLRDSFQKLPAGHPHALTPDRIARHEEAARHPDAADLAKARTVFRKLLEMAADQ